MKRAPEWLRKAAGRVFLFGFDGGRALGAKGIVEELHAGGAALFARNIEGPGQARALTDGLQAMARAAGRSSPLLIAADQENGIVRRLRDGFTLFPGSMALGAAKDPDLTRAVAEATGVEMRAVGIGMNFAPVLDVNNNPQNPVIGVRSFGSDPESVALHGTAAALGLADAGVTACGKHFPGHGDTDVDSHLALPRVPHGRERLDAVELVPFRRAIAVGLPAVMVAHVSFPALDPDGLPATLSKAAVTGLLREELGFSGVIVTDSLEMKAVSAKWGVARGAVMAFQAGCDLLVVARGFDAQRAAYEALIDAVMSGEVTRGRLEESVERIEAMKSRAGGESSRPALSAIRSPRAQSLADLAGERAVTVIRGGELLPIRPAAHEPVLFLGADGETAREVQEAPERWTVLGELSKRHANVRVRRLSEFLLAGPAGVASKDPVAGKIPDAADVPCAPDAAGPFQARYVVLDLPEGFRTDDRKELERLCAPDAIFAGILAGNPDGERLRDFPPLLLAVYDRTPSTFRAAVRVLFGDLRPAGAAPLTAPRRP